MDDQPKWEKKPLTINTKMVEVLKVAVKATESELEVLRRKLKKLQYGG